MNAGITAIAAALMLAGMTAHASPANEAAVAKVSAIKEKPVTATVASAGLPPDKNSRRGLDKNPKQSPARPTVAAEPLNGFSPLYIDP